MIFPALASPLRRDETVLLLPTLGRRDTNRAEWILPVHAWVFEREMRAPALALFRKTLGLDSLSEAEQALFAERARAFLVDNQRGKQLSVRLGSRLVPLARTGPNGHTLTTVRLPDEALGLPAGQPATNGFRARCTVAMPKGDTRVFAGEVLLLADQGLSVVSDLDDTIKISNVLHKKELLRNTFLRPFTPVPGMAGVYQHWAASAGAQFHYVSASPWNLYPSVDAFLAAHGFPRGSVHMKQVRLKDRTALELFASPVTYKLGAIEPLFRDWPHRRFVLVGDTGEQDPEIYGTLARRHPQQVTAICLRNVTGETREAARFQNAFAGVPADRWHLFTDPAQIKGAVPSAAPEAAPRRP